METNRLRQFCAIAETGSISSAARLLHITHSGLSKSMKLLQEELGCLLLRPSGRGLALTEAGMAVYQRAKELLEHEKRLFNFDKSIAETTLRIGAVEIFLLTICEQLKQNTLDSRSMTLLDLDPGNMEQLIATRQLDFGITYAPHPMESVEITEICKYQLGCYYLQSAFKGKNIADIPFVVPAHGLSANPLDIRERDGWLDAIYPREKKYSVNRLATAINLTMRGLCAIYIPDFVAKKLNTSYRSREQLTKYLLPKKHKRTQSVFLLKHKDRPDDATSKQLIKIIRELCN